MLRMLVIAVICCSATFMWQTSLRRTAWAQETKRISPSSGGVEIAEIFVNRRTALGAAKDADLTYMVLGLWFAADWETKVQNYVPLVHIQSLSAIEDDTGRVLATETRLKKIQHLRGEVSGDSWKSSGGKQGPIVSLVLDAPSRGANKLIAIKGRAHVTLAKPMRLTFDDLAAVRGKDLEHPEMKSLAAMKLRFAIVEEKDDGLVSGKLSAPVNYASPWKRGRLYDWDLTDGETDLFLFSESTLPKGEGVTVIKSYRHETSKGLSLHLVVLDAFENKDFSFDIRNVALP